MTGSRGPKSKEGAVRRNKPKAPTNIVAPLASAPDPPDSLGVEARAWWDALVSSPWVDKYQATDWQTALRGVVLVDLFYAKPSAQLAAQIGAVEAKLGATVSDRDRLGWKLEPPAPADGEAKPTPSRDRPDPRVA